jgi:hypothetical protein
MGLKVAAKPTRGRPPAPKQAARILAKLTDAEDAWIRQQVSAEQSLLMMEETREWMLSFERSRRERRGQPSRLSGRPLEKEIEAVAVLALCDIWHNKTGKLPGASNSSRTDFQDFALSYIETSGLKLELTGVFQAAIRYWKSLRTAHNLHGASKSFSWRLYS